MVEQRGDPITCLVNDLKLWIGSEYGSPSKKSTIQDTGYFASTSLYNTWENEIYGYRLDSITPFWMQI